MSTLVSRRHEIQTEWSPISVLHVPPATEPAFKVHHPQQCPSFSAAGRTMWTIFDFIFSSTWSSSVRSDGLPDCPETRIEPAVGDHQYLHGLPLQQHHIYQLANLNLDLTGDVNDLLVTACCVKYGGPVVLIEITVSRGADATCSMCNQYAKSAPMSTAMATVIQSTTHGMLLWTCGRGPTAD